PQVHVTGSATHPEDDEALVGLLELVLDGAEPLEELQAWDSEGGEARHVLKEMPPIHSAAHVPSPLCSVERTDSVSPEKVVLCFNPCCFGFGSASIGAADTLTISICDAICQGKVPANAIFLTVF